MGAKLRMNAGQSRYIPGVCNIGKQGIAQRRMAGMVGIGAAVVIGAGLILVGAPRPWRLLVFFPAALGAIGLIQAHWHFCAALGLGGVFNFDGKTGRDDTPQQVGYRREDQKTALKIFALSGAIGAAVAVLLYVLPV